MGLIANSKQGDCSRCPATNTAVRKRGKELFCLACCRTEDVKSQMAKQREKVLVRNLITYEREEGILDSIQELTIDLDRVVSRYLRLAAMGLDHKCECYTCGIRKDWKKMQAGHFISRRQLALRWDTTYNVKVQCNECNVVKQGNLEVYAAKLEEENKGIVEYLYEKSRSVENTTRTELKVLLCEFQNKLRIVEQAKLK